MHTNVVWRIRAKNNLYLRKITMIFLQRLLKLIKTSSKLFLFIDPVQIIEITQSHENIIHFRNLSLIWIKSLSCQPFFPMGKQIRRSLAWRFERILNKLEPKFYLDERVGCHDRYGVLSNFKCSNSDTKFAPVTVLTLKGSKQRWIFCQSLKITVIVIFPAKKQSL